jgi:APA family basic amino acid/polyamine antiporter
MRRALGRLDVTCLGLNAIVGSGIFLLPDDLYRELGAWSPLAFACCAVGLLPVAWCYARAARTCEHNGGPYIYARDAFGPHVGFAVGWMCFANAIFSFAAVVSAAAAYAARLFPVLSGATTEKLVACTLVGVFTTLNYVGSKPAATTVNVFTFAKFGVLGLITATLVPHFDSDAFTDAGALEWSNVSRATFIALFAAQGFEVVPVPAGETQNPRRVIPFAILGAMGVASALYIVVQTALVGAGADLTSVTDTPLADAAMAVAPWVGVVIAFGGLLSTVGFVSGSALGTPRYLHAMGKTAQLPKFLAEVHPSFGSPYVAIVTTGACAVLLILPLDYRDLLGMSNVAVATQYFVTCLAVFTQRGAHGWWRPVVWLPILGLGVSAWIFTEASSEELVWSLGSLTVGYALLFASRRQRRA